MTELDQETLLGYLLNALDDHDVVHVERELLRQPRLRSELAALQQELAPLNYACDSVDPPPFLARRTCDKIWAAVDREEANDFLKPVFAPVNTLSHSRFSGEMCALNPASTVAEQSSVPVPPRETVTPIPAEPCKKTAKTVRWFGFAASVAAGIFVGLMVFPLVNILKHETRNFITQNHLNQINQRVDQYERVNNEPNKLAVIPNQESGLPFNLALTGWQELNSNFDGVVPVAVPTSPVSATSIPIVPRNSTRNRDIFLGQANPNFSHASAPQPAAFSGISDRTLISAPGQPVQTAFGQDILIKDGRIYFRILPGMPPKEN
jgi:hypothetical protein